MLYSPARFAVPANSTKATETRFHDLFRRIPMPLVLHRTGRVIDANPAAFRARSQELVSSMDEIVAAAQSKDAAKLFEVSGSLDQVCENCHMQFWYPQQKAAR